MIYKLLVYNYIRQFINRPMKLALVTVLLVLTYSQIVPNCVIQNNTDHTCITCLTGYQNTNGTCSTCSEGFSSRNGNCEPIATAASNTTTSQQQSQIPLTVSQMIPGFIVFQNPCTAIDANMRCTACTSGYTVVNGSCAKNQQSTTSPTSSSITASPSSSTTTTSASTSTSSPLSLSTSTSTSATSPSTSSSATTSSPSPSPSTSTSSSSSAQIGGQSTSSALSSSVNAAPSNTQTSVNAISNSSVLSTVMQSTNQGQSVSISNIQFNLDPSCGAFDPQTLECTKCAQSYHQNPLSTTVSCIMNDPLCKAYTGDYACSDCYHGYTLINGSCVVTVATSASDPYCKNLTNGSCAECYGGYYLNNLTSRCEVANSQCRQIDSQNTCLGCYGGYLLINGSCIKTQSTINSQSNTISFFQSSDWGIFYPFIIPISVSSSLGYQDPNCKNFTNGVCVECSYRTYPKNGVCVMVDTSCDGFNSTTGECLTCFTGYTVSNGTCVVQSNVVVFCPFRSVNIYGVCVKVSDLCKEWNSVTALCTRCYLGYTEVNGACITV